MTKRRYRHLWLLHNGDWHTELLASLKTAKAEADSCEIKAAIEALEALLATVDECIHTVTAERQVPDRLEANMVMRHVLDEIKGVRASARFKTPAVIELTLTERGSHHHVLFVANSLLASGISAAQAEVWVCLQFGGKA